MAIFAPNVPVVTATPTVEVEGLSPGPHRFQLVVEDESGNRSQPSIAAVTVLGRAPVITSVSPAFGAWEDQVVITGENFDPVPNVVFNGVAAKVESTSGTQLIVRVPQPATTGPLKVLTGTGQVASSTLFVIPRVFTIEVARVDVSSQQLGFALDSVKGNLWVLNGFPGANFGTLDVINLEQKELLGTVFRQNPRVQSQPKEIAVAAEGERRVCVVLNSDGVVSAVNLDSREVVGSIQVGLGGIPGNALALDITPDGHWAYVLIAPLPSINLPAQISVIDMSAFKVVSTIPVGRAPTRVVFSRDGQFAVVNNTADGTISLIDARSLIDVRAHKVIAVVKVGGSVTSNPQEVAFSEKNFPIWAANLGSRNASIITEQTLAANGGTDIGTNIDLGFGPQTVALTRDGTRAFLLGPQDKLMAKVETAEGKPILRTIRISGRASTTKTIATTPDDRAVLVIHPDNSMSVLETKTLSVRAIVNLPVSPLRCLITNDGKFAAVLGAKTVSIVEMESVLPT
jgi:DNA-binding beta-propeller fold protein YncE